MVTVNTNVAAMAALSNLNATNRQLNIVQNRINTGLAVASAKDNGAIYAIAQNMRAEIGGMRAVNQSLSRGTSTVDVGMAAAEGISDILIEMKEKALAAADASIDTSSRSALNEDFTALRDQIRTMYSNAEFNGVNIIDGSTANIQSLADADASSFITVAGEDFSLSGAIISLTSTQNVATQAAASTTIATVDASLQNVNEALARLGTASKKLEVHSIFIDKISDALRAGVGNLVDADLAAESAALQALQVKQQLGIQALSIANQAPQTLLGLFQ